MKKLFTLICTGIIGISSLYSQCTDLFFSEYIESGGDKAIEIYNPTSAAINLSDYKIKRYNNGAGTPNQTLTFTTETIPAGGTFVLYNSTFDLTGFTPNGVTDMSSGITGYNGDDALELVNASSGSDVIIDVIGEVGVDPGSNWPVSDGGGNTGTTEDHIMIRLASVNAGITNWTAGADTWDATAIGTSANSLGSHTMTPCVAPSNPEVQFQGATASVDEDGTSIDITVNIVSENSNATSVDLVLLGTGSAVQGTDFTYASTQTVTFPASSSTAQTVTIPIIDNMLVDGDLTFELELQNTTNSATIGTNSNIVVTIVDDEVPQHDIDDINDLDGDGVAVDDGLECQLHGYVYGVNMRATGVQFTLHDGTGGIGVINFSSNLGYTVTEGDSIDVIGTIDQFNGFLQIEVTEINLHSQGHTLPAPTIVAVLDESTESELIQINNVWINNIADWSPGGAGFNADVTDGTNTFTMRIDADVDLHSMMAPDGTFDLIGIGGQFDNSSPYTEGYQLLPRYNNDIQIKPEIIDGDQTVCPEWGIVVDYSNVTYLWHGTNLTTQDHPTDTSGTYTVDVSYGSVTVTISAVITLSTDIPDAGMSVSPVTVCMGDDVIFTDTSVNSNSFTIYLGDGNDVNSSPYTHQYNTQGSYDAIIVATSNFGCDDSSTVQITVNDCASIEEFDKIALNVYPNPSNGLSQIATNIQGTYELKILDLTGQVVKTIRTSNQIVDLNMTDQPAGIYFLNLTSTQGTNTVKLIVK